MACLSNGGKSGRDAGQKFVTALNVVAEIEPGTLMQTETPPDKPSIHAASTLPTSRWVPSRDTALERLKRFLPKAGRLYQTHRNEDFGPQEHPHVSALSPYLRHRLLLDEEVLLAVLEHHSPSSARKFIEEIFWRSYFKGWLEHHPNVWRQYDIDQRALHRQMRTDSTLRRRYLAAISSNSGIDLFDDWVEELRTSGYLHNHARMWFASIWIFTLKLPWQLGARWFHYHLLDGDAACNTLSWRWVAGLHTRGKTYLARPENIQRYASRRLRAGDDSLKGLVSTAEALQETPEIALLVKPSWPQLTDAEAIPSSGRTGLLLHDEDLTIGTPAAGLRAAAVLAPMRRGRRTASRSVARFGLGASMDTLTRLSDLAHLDVEPKLLRGIPAVLRWARELRLDSLLVPYAPVGELNEALAMLTASSDGMKVVPYRRRLDCLAWPHAKKGYFGLKNHIPTILERLSIS